MVAQRKPDPRDDPVDPIREELERIRQLTADGILLPADVVNAARFDSSPLHSAFDWDDASAAQSYRIEQARQLIRGITVEIHTTTTVVSTVAYIRDPEANGNTPGYRPLVEVRTQKQSAANLLTAEVGRVAGLVARVRSVAAGLGLEREAEEQLRATLG